MGVDYSYIEYMKDFMGIYGIAQYMAIVMYSFLPENLHMYIL